jgi:hypothetical protein
MNVLDEWEVYKWVRIFKGRWWTSGFHDDGDGDNDGGGGGDNDDNDNACSGQLSNVTCFSSTTVPWI